MTAAERAFPDGFVWGTATAAHQVEGGNWNAAGGWAEPATADRFARFCARAAGHLGDAMQRACTLNEPNVVATAGYLDGRFPPGERDGDRRRRVNEVFVDAHAKATTAIKEAAGVPVGLTLAMSDDQAVDGGEAALAEHRGGWEDPYLEAARGDDFIGVQTYTRHRFGPEGMLDPEPGVPLTMMGYELWPRRWGRPSAGPPPPPAPRCSSPRTASPPTTTPSASSLPARPSTVSWTAWTTGWTCAATPTGACSTTSSGPTATGQPSAWSRSTGPPRPAPPSPARPGWARSRGPTHSPGGPRMPDRPSPGDAVPEVLFVCVHNAGRSQMAAALLDHHANGRVRVRSAGSAPGDRLNPAVVAAMGEVGIDLSKEFPKPLTDESVRAADAVITMGCGDACPIYPGKRYEDWELQDPAGQPVEVVRRIRDDIDARVWRLLAELVPAGS